MDNGEFSFQIERMIQSLEKKIKEIADEESKIMSEVEKLQSELNERREKLKEYERRIKSSLEVKVTLFFKKHFNKIFGIMCLVHISDTILIFYMATPEHLYGQSKTNAPFYLTIAILLLITFSILLLLLIRLALYEPSACRSLREAQIIYDRKVMELESMRTRLDKLKSEKASLEGELGMVKKGLIPFIDEFGVKRYLTLEQVKEWKIMEMDMKNRFAALTPRQFESLIMKLFQAMGYKTQLTPYVKDYGADVIAEKGLERVVVQVKKYTNPKQRVGSTDIQRLLGAMITYNANKAIFITTTDFTNEARKQAKGTPAELWNYTMLCKKIREYLLKF